VKTLNIKAPSILMQGRRSAKRIVSSFRRKPESRFLRKVQNNWTPVFTGVTAFCETVNVQWTLSSQLYACGGFSHEQHAAS
jgi:hypothetical protein